MNVSLPPDLKRWIDREVKTGGYGTASEFLRDMLRRARERQLRHRIDAKLLEAVEAGAKTVMDDRDWDSIRKAARTRVARPGRKKS